MLKSAATEAQTVGKMSLLRHLLSATCIARDSLRGSPWQTKTLMQPRCSKASIKAELVSPMYAYGTPSEPHRSFGHLFSSPETNIYNNQTNQDSNPSQWKVEMGMTDFYRSRRRHSWLASHHKGTVFRNSPSRKQVELSQ